MLTKGFKHLNMGHKQAGYNGEAACLFVSQPACGRLQWFVSRVPANTLAFCGYALLRQHELYLAIQLYR